MAVLVQTMVQAEVAGVMFTINPMSGRTDQIVISAHYGLGEAVVGGSVTPDTFVIDKHTLNLRERMIAPKEVMVVGAPGGQTRTTTVAAEKSRVASLSHGDVAALGALGRETEALFGSAQDIEWAWADGGFFRLQARPALSPRALSAPHAPRYNRLERLFLEFLLDYFPTPPHHFDRSILLSLIDRTLRLAAMFGLTPPSAAGVLRAESDGTLSLVPVLPRVSLWTIPGVVIGSARALRSLRVDPDTWQRERWPGLAPHIDQLLVQDVPEMTDAELLTLIRRSLALRDDGIFSARLDYLLGGWIAIGALPLALRLVAGRAASQLHARLLSGLDHPRPL